MEIRGDTYRVAYDEVTSTVMFEGTLRLLGAAGYDPIGELLDEVIRAAPEIITLDLRELRFLNSAGVDVFFRFVDKVHRQKSRLVVRISAQASWQKRLMAVMRGLVPQLQLDPACAR